MFSEIKQNMSNSIDLLEKNFGMKKIVPMKISRLDGKILKTLALKWMKLRKFKNDKNWDEKSENGEKYQKYMEELLQFLKGLLNNVQIEIPGIAGTLIKIKLLKIHNSIVLKFTIFLDRDSLSGILVRI